MLSAKFPVPVSAKDAVIIAFTQSPFFILPNFFVVIILYGNG